MKAKALANCEVAEDRPLARHPWRYDKGLMEFRRMV